jgi:hypothetical protein
MDRTATRRSTSTPRWRNQTAKIRGSIHPMTPTHNRLDRALALGREALERAGLIAELPEVGLAVEAHRWAWRPGAPAGARSRISISPPWGRGHGLRTPRLRPPCASCVASSSTPHSSTSSRAEVAMCPPSSPARPSRGGDPDAAGCQESAPSPVHHPERMRQIEHGAIGDRKVRVGFPPSALRTRGHGRPLADLPRDQADCHISCPSDRWWWQESGSICVAATRRTTQPWPVTFWRISNASETRFCRLHVR